MLQFNGHLSGNAAAQLRDIPCSTQTSVHLYHKQPLLHLERQPICNTKLWITWAGSSLDPPPDHTAHHSRTNPRPPLVHTNAFLTRPTPPEHTPPGLLQIANGTAVKAAPFATQHCNLANPPQACPPCLSHTDTMGHVTVPASPLPPMHQLLCCKFCPAVLPGVPLPSLEGNIPA